MTPKQYFFLETSWIHFFLLQKRIVIYFYRCTLTNKYAIPSLFRNRKKNNINFDVCYSFVAGYQIKIVQYTLTRKLQNNDDNMVRFGMSNLFLFIQFILYIVQVHIDRSLLILSGSLQSFSQYQQSHAWLQSSKDSSRRN